MSKSPREADGLSRMERHHVWVEVKRSDRATYKRREYDVEAPSRAEAEQKALEIAREEWADARLPGKTEVF